MPALTVRLADGAAVFNPALIAETELRHLLALSADERGRPLPGAAGRSGVRLVEQAGRQWVWRHNCRGGWCRRISRDSYLWLGEARTRTFQEWRLLHEMRLAGLPVPAPVAAIYRRSGLTYTCDLITSYLPGTSSLGAHLTCGTVGDETWSAVGECIRRFHADGVCHADLNAHNVLIGTDNVIYLVDFDRGRKRPPGAWVEGNWRRLRRSVEKITGLRSAHAIPPAGWLALQVQQRVMIWSCLAFVPF